MTRRQAGTFRLLPALLQQTLLAQTHEQRIEGARPQAGLLRQIIAMPPRSGLLQKRAQQGPGLAGAVGSARHDRIINICRVYVKARSGGTMPLVACRPFRGPYSPVPPVFFAVAFIARRRA